MSEYVTSDPAAAIKWLSVFFGFAALYMQLRRWESRIGGKLDKIEIQQPITVRDDKDPIVLEHIAPIERRVVTLENEVRVIRLKMEADKTEILNKIEDLAKSNQDGFRALERAIGRLEGKQL